MLRLTNNLWNLCLNETINSNYQCLTTVRWRVRKPMWMPRAKSKLFRVPPRKVIPVEETEEMKRLFNNYRTQVKSIRRFLFLKHNVQFLESLDPEVVKKQFEDDFERCMEINNKWNEEQKVIREKQAAEALEKDIELAKSRIELRKVTTKQRQDEIEEIVRREKENAKNFIAQEDLDKVIEFAINNPVDYNFAIDLDGNRIYGRETQPEEQQKINVKQ